MGTLGHLREGRAIEAVVHVVERNEVDDTQKDAHTQIEKVEIDVILSRKPLPAPF